MSIKNAQPSAKWLEILTGGLSPSQPIVISGTTTTGSPNISPIGNLAGVAIGDRVQGLDILDSPPTTFIDLDDVTHAAVCNQNITTGHNPTPLTITHTNAPLVLLAGLFTGNPSPLTIDTVLGDLAEPTYSGYARQALTIGSLRRDVEGNYIEPLGSVSFQPTDDVGLPQTATGVFITGTIGGVEFLLLSEFLDAPFEFTNHFFGLDVDLDMYFKNVTEYGGICTVC